MKRAKQGIVFRCGHIGPVYLPTKENNAFVRAYLATARRGDCPRCIREAAAKRVSPTERALQIIAQGERFHFRDGAVVRGGFRVGQEVVVPYFARTLYVAGTRVRGYWSEEDAVAIAYRRRLDQTKGA